jgi:indolepyruvate ferredoxin oxidoreductase alpha subunit
MSRPPRHEVLQGAAGTRACLLGNVAMARGALEAGVQFFSCYPGTPASEIGDTMARVAGDTGVTFEYSVNEKVAVEIAFAASLAGARSMCSMKHLGLNYANDPLSTIPYVGVEGGMVIVSAGDPSAITSPNEQDQRHFSRFLYYPMLDPATPDDGLRMTRDAFVLSEATRLPVIIRPTTRICHSSGMVELGALSETRREIRFTKDPPRHVPIPPNARRMRTELSARYARAEDALGRSAFFPRRGTGPHGIVASGVAYAYVAQIIEDLGLGDTVTLQQIGGYPIPQRLLAEFLKAVTSVLVVEELTPFVEEQVALCAFHHDLQLPVLGKHSGHFPVEFEYSPDLVEDAVRRYLKLERPPAPPPPAVTVPELPPRPPVLCPGCPHRASFYLARRVFGKKTVYCNDIGCYTLGYGEPLDTCDVVLCMGSSISQASGIARMTGTRTAAFIGDSTFFHSGLPALANAVQADDPVTVVILDNYVTAMTGFQPSLTTGQGAAPGAPLAARAPRFSIEEAVRGLGVSELYSVNPFDETETLAALRKARTGTGVNVVVCHAPCAVVEGRLKAFTQKTPVEVDQEVCNECSLCVRLLGCPGILVVDGKYVIDPALCDACGVCATVCQHDAIHPVSQETQ